MWLELFLNRHTRNPPTPWNALICQCIIVYIPGDPQSAQLVNATATTIYRIVPCGKLGLLSTRQANCHRTMLPGVLECSLRQTQAAFHEASELPQDNATWYIRVFPAANSGCFPRGK